MVIKRYVFILFVFISLPLYSQQAIDFTEGLISIKIDPKRENIQGEVTYKFTSGMRTDSLMVDARKMNIKEIRVNNKTSDFSYDDNRITVYRKLKADKHYTMRIAYETSPEKAVYFIGWNDDMVLNNQVWTQGQGKYSSHWVPSFDDMSEKVVFSLNISFDKGYEVIANGSLKGTEIRDSIKTWKYEMNNPMSSYLLAFAIGKYKKDTLITTSNIPLELYSYPGHFLKVEPTYRYTGEIMDFLENEIGFPYPWQNYKQVPVQDFLYAGMENTGTTIFSDSFLIDSLAFIDKNYVSVNAHEMAHQWFGNLVTEVEAKDHWLHEGFATYYSLLAERELFGDEYYYWKLFESAQALKNQEGEALKDPKASSLTFYEKGAWALVMLREAIGDKAFRSAIERFLQAYAFKNATIEDFLGIVQQETSTDLKTFEETWLESTEFPYQSAQNYLKQYSPSLRLWYEFRWELTTSPEENEQIIRRYWEKTDSVYFKRQVISKFLRSFSISFIKEILATGEVELRRAVAIHLERVPPELKAEFETLLNDPSYLTVENSLFKLWIYFPGERERFLETTKGIVGLPNKNVRILWLFLAILTGEFETTADKLEYRNELFGYTSPSYPFEVRQTAFSVISEVFELPDDNLKDLINASVHHSWQFRSFARNLLSEILKDEKQKERLKVLAAELNEVEQRYLTKQLEGK